MLAEEREEQADPWTPARYHPTTLPLPDGEGQAPATSFGIDPASAVPQDLMTREVRGPWCGAWSRVLDKELRRRRGVGYVRCPPPRAWQRIAPW